VVPILLIHRLAALPILHLLFNKID
jgi:hypothetical protein